MNSQILSRGREREEEEEEWDAKKEEMMRGGVSRESSGA